MAILFSVPSAYFGKSIPKVGLMRAGLAGYINVILVGRIRGSGTDSSFTNGYLVEMPLQGHIRALSENLMAQLAS